MSFTWLELQEIRSHLPNVEPHRRRCFEEMLDAVEGFESVQQERDDARGALDELADQHIALAESASEELDTKMPEDTKDWDVGDWKAWAVAVTKRAATFAHNLRVEAKSDAHMARLALDSHEEKLAKERARAARAKAEAKILRGR